MVTPHRTLSRPIGAQVKEFVIPDHLRLLPTDSEEEKARKRKKVKHLKAQWKQRHAGALEAQAEAQQGGGPGSWKDYLNKSKKKSKGLGALKKGSIFKSPDTVDGRVGVVGSGQGMTDFEKRNTFTKRNVMR
jgi:survival of motor neuron-related-splicing factor 30